jgi:hypothetical protein
VSRELVEISTKLIIDEIQENIVDALAGVSTDRADSVVNLEAPRKYYFYEKVDSVQMPAIFVIPTDIDFRQSEKKSNFINAYTRFNVVALVEDPRGDLVTQKAWRYQAALHEILDQKSLVSESEKTKIKIIVIGASFSPIYTDAENKTSAAGIFKKEAVLDCKVEHYENQD